MAGLHTDQILEMDLSLYHLREVAPKRDQNTSQSGTASSNNNHNDCKRYSLSELKPCKEDRMISTISCLFACSLCLSPRHANLRLSELQQALPLSPLGPAVLSSPPQKPVCLILALSCGLPISENCTHPGLCYSHHTLRSLNLSAPTCSFLSKGRGTHSLPSWGCT